MRCFSKFYLLTFVFAFSSLGSPAGDHSRNLPSLPFPTPKGANNRAAWAHVIANLSLFRLHSVFSIMQSIIETPLQTVRTRRQRWTKTKIQQAEKYCIRVLIPNVWITLILHADIKRILNSHYYLNCRRSKRRCWPDALDRWSHTMYGSGRPSIKSIRTALTLWFLRT